MGPFKSIVIATFMLSAGAASADPIFSEDFENGTAQWTAVDGQPIDIASDDATCSTHYQHETIATVGGRLGTSPVSLISMTGGLDYCLSMFIRSSEGTIPFAAIETYDWDGNQMGEHWLIGEAGYDNSFNGTAVPVQSDGTWRWYAAPFTLQAMAHSVRIKYELYEAGAAGFADFDDIRLTEGPCPSQYGGVDQHQSCGGAYCSADGSCGCSTDANCGETNSGSICDGQTHQCVAGCRGTDGNGCGAGKVCSSMNSDAGTCNPGEVIPSTPSNNGPMAAANGMMTEAHDSTPAAATPAEPTTNTVPMMVAGGGGGCSMGGTMTRESALAPMMLVMLALMVVRFRRRNNNG
jgi:hypothetical protein